jgi:hypothetical protein
VQARTIFDNNRVLRAEPTIFMASGVNRTCGFENRNGKQSALRKPKSLFWNTLI